MIRKNMIPAILLVICLCVSIIPEKVYAQEGQGISLQNIEEEDLGKNTVTGDDDPGKGRLRGNAPAEFYDKDRKMRALATGIQHNSKFAGYKIVEGIDVSKYNQTINWTAVKKSGIDFAFVRTSYRGYGKAGTLADDPYAAVNMKNAAAAGVRVGAYIFSQAITVKEAQEEADYLLNSVKGYKITMPLVFDFEYFKGGRLENAGLTRRKKTDICLAFCERVKAAGYTPLVYANKSMLTNDLYASEISSKYPVWLAHYTSSSDYKGDYSFWQYTEYGTVSGISGNVDKNFWYVKPGGSMSFDAPDTAETVTPPTVTLPEETPPAVKAPSAATLSGKAASYDQVKLTWKKVPGVTGYSVYRYDSLSKSYKKIKTISGAAATSYTDTGRTMGTTYKYRIKTYKNAEGSTVYSKYSNTVSVKTNSTMTGKINGTGVAVRKGPSILKGKIKTLSINTGVTITGTSGSWYRISLKTGGKEKTGYIKKTYVTIIRKPALSVSSASSGRVKLTWGKVSGANGYEIERYDPSKKSYVKIKTIKNGSTVSYTNSGLKKNTTYRYRMRSYKTVRGKKIYSYYCEVKSIKTK